MTIRQEIIVAVVWQYLNRGGRRRIWLHLNALSIVGYVRRRSGLRIQQKDVAFALDRLAGQHRLRRRGPRAVWLC